MRYIIRLFLGVIIMIAAGCSGKPGDSRLLEISEKVSASPEDMLSRLDSIDVGSLGEADRHFHALLRIKAQDKAFVGHTSDSVILPVIDYYSRHKGSGLYPEALYYAGRVYSDLGDAPTVLRYFQDALDALPADADKSFRATILSQTGRHLNSLRLYTEAARYLEESTNIEPHKNSIKRMRNVQLLGAIYMHSERYDEADSCFRIARRLGQTLSHSDTVIHDMYIAGSELQRGNVEDALRKIRSAMSGNPTNRRDIMYAYAAQIYLEAEALDTAYLYACKLAVCNNNDYRKIGYSLLLSPELRQYSSSDSLLSYSLIYRELLDEYLNRHDAKQVDMQTSLYNYRIHERERKKAEESRRIYMSLAVVALVLAMALSLGLLYLRNRKMKLRLAYHAALDNIDLLEQSLYTTQKKLIKFEEEANDATSRKTFECPMPDDETSATSSDDMSACIRETEEDSVREQLKQKLLTLQKAGEARKNQPENILGAPLYTTLQEYLAKERWPEEGDGIWMEIEKEVLKVSPEFISRLTLLIGGKMKPDVYHMSLLIRCGFGPKDIGTLLGRTKGAVSSRRGYICEKIFGEKLGVKVMDDIINLL